MKKAKIYQIFYDEISKNGLDKGFTPYNNSENLKDIFENEVIIDVFKNKKIEWSDTSHVGILSWRLKEKTGITSEYLYKKIGSKPVYLLTPKSCFRRKSPVSESGFKTSIALAKLFDKHKVFPFKVYNYDNGKCINCCNYWLASPEVFSDYVKNFLLKAVEFCRTNRQAVEISSTLVRYRGQLYPSIVFFLEALFQIYVHYRKIDYEYILNDNAQECDNENHADINIEHKDLLANSGEKNQATKVIIKNCKPAEYSSALTNLKKSHEQRQLRRKEYTSKDHDITKGNYCENKKIIVSIIVTLFNYQDLIKKCLLSAINQKTNLGYEIILVNDCSTDKSLSIAESVLKNNKVPYTIINKSKNTGLAHSRNQGISISKGEYFFILDADNYIKDNCIQVHYDTIVKSGNIAAYAKIKCIEKETGKEFYKSDSNFNPDVLFNHGNYIDAMAMFHKEKVKSIGTYDENMPYMGWEDYDLWLNIATNNFDVDFIGTELSYYVAKNDSMITNTNLFRNEIKKYLKNKYVYFERPFNSNKKICVIIHLFYTEMAEEINDYVLKIKSHKYDLFITVQDNISVDEFNRVKQIFGNCTIKKVANVGQDIGGFISVLKDIDLSKYDFFFKLHTKKSREEWRKDLLDAILKDENTFLKCIYSMSTEGYFMVGSDKWKSSHINRNKTHYNNLCDLFGYIDKKIVPYISGTIFAGRIDILKEIKTKKIPDDYFDCAYSYDGEKQHAFERFFGKIVEQLGGKILFQ